MMKYTIENKGTGVVMIRLFIPDVQVSSFLAFIDQKSRENVSTNRKSSPLHDEDFLKNRVAFCVSTYRSFFNSGMTKSEATSATLQKLKTGNYHTIGYDSLKAILSHAGCFRLKKRQLVAL